MPDGEAIGRGVAEITPARARRERAERAPPAVYVRDRDNFRVWDFSRLWEPENFAAAPEPPLVDSG
jgi:hypothetical protein